MQAQPKHKENKKHPVFARCFCDVDVGVGIGVGVSAAALPCPTLLY